MYYLQKQIVGGFEEVEEKVRGVLLENGFGVLTEINVKETLKKKLDVDFRRYKILGACNPPFAFKALTLEENIGVLMPCNVVIQEKEDNFIYISIVNPMEAMQSVGNEELAKIAGEISEKLRKIIEQL